MKTELGTEVPAVGQQRERPGSPTVPTLFGCETEQERKYLSIEYNAC